MPSRYDYRCEKCGCESEVLLPMTSNPRVARKCPKCGKRALKRVVTLGSLRMAFECFDMHIGYQNRFPYVSNSLPFKGNLAGDGRHIGKVGKILVANSKHEERLRRVHGYVGEDKIGMKVS